MKELERKVCVGKEEGGKWKKRKNASPNFDRREKRGGHGGKEGREREAQCLQMLSVFSFLSHHSLSSSPFNPSILFSFLSSSIPVPLSLLPAFLPSLPPPPPFLPPCSHHLRGSDGQTHTLTPSLTQNVVYRQTFKTPN